MTTQEEIREIWQEMKNLKRMREDGENGDIREAFEVKFSGIEANFGNESTLSKAIIYFLTIK